MPDYEILLHGSNLTLLDEKGTPCRGGVYAWVFVAASDEAAAIAKAREELKSDRAFLDELWEPTVDSVVLDVDEIRVRPPESAAKEASPVFYLDESE